MSDESKSTQDRILDKLDTIDVRLDGMSKTLIIQGAHLEEHIRRSDALERRCDLIEEDQNEKRKKVEKKVDEISGIVNPVYNFVKISLKLLIIVGTIVGIAVGFISLFS